MMSDEYLTGVFCRELEETQDLAGAVRAVRLAIDAYREERRHQRQMLLVDGGRRGPMPKFSLTPGDVEFIINLVADEVGMSVETLRIGPARSSLHARWVVAGVLRRFGSSLPAIARVLGMRDHTRALEGLRRLTGFPGLAACRDRVVASLEARGWTPGPRATPPREEA